MNRHYGYGTVGHRESATLRPRQRRAIFTVPLTRRIIPLHLASPSRINLRCDPSDRFQEDARDVSSLCYRVTVIQPFTRQNCVTSAP